MRFWFLSAVLTVLVSYQNVSGQVSGDFRTSGGGDWNDLAIWQRYNGTTWVAATAFPTSANGAITISTNHTVTLPVGFSVTVDQLTNNHQLVVNGTLTLANGTGDDLIAPAAVSQVVVNGVLAAADGATVGNGGVAARLQFAAGGEYRHQYSTSVGSLPTAQWNAASTITLAYANIVAITATDNSWSQTLPNVVYNSPGQRALVDFTGKLTTIQGNLSILASGNNAVQFSSNEGIAMTVGGNLTASGVSRFILSTEGTSSLTVQGNFTFNATPTAGSYLTYVGTNTTTIYGNFSVNAGSGGRLRLAHVGTTGVGTMNFYGNFSIITGRIEESGSNPTQGNIRFLAQGTQTFVNTGAIVGYINTYISPQTTLDMGTSMVTGVSPAAFTLEGTVIVGSPDPKGAIQNSTSLGNIRTPYANRTYAVGSTIVYRGTGAQYIGIDHPSTANVTTVIDNANGVTLSSNVTIGGVLTLRNGNLNMGSYQLTVNGTVTSTGGRLAGTSLSRLTIGGTTGGSSGTLLFAASAAKVGILTLNRTGANAGVTLNSTLQVDSIFNLTNGVFTNTSGLTMRNNATIVRDNTATLAGTAPATTGAYNVSYRTVTSTTGPFPTFNTGLELPSGTTTLRDLTITPLLAAEIVQLDKPITINGTLNLARGTLQNSTYAVTMQGPTWADNAGNFTQGSGPVIFNGTTIVAGSTNPTFGDIQLNAGKSLTFTRNPTITGNITFQPGGTLVQGSTTLILGGSTVQTISAGGVPIGNINIAKSNGAGVQLTSTFNLTGILQFVSPSANVNFASNGFLVVRSTSDAAGAADQGSIYRLAGGNTISGNVTVERYMSPEGRIYRYLSSPIANATVAQWKDDFPITGKFTDPSASSTICGEYVRSTSPSLFYYDEVVTGNVNTGYVAYPLPATSTTNSALQVGRGYSAFVRECAVPTVVDVTGPINQGTITYPVTFTATADVDANGWNLVGNPYPATIAWDVPVWTRTRVSTTISIMDNATGMMRYYEPGVTNDISGGLIAPGQAFFVRATAANPILRSVETVKVTTGAEFFRAPAIDIPSFSLTLSDGVLYDAAYVKLVPAAQPGLDSLDSPKLYNPTFSFSTLAADSRPMAINALGGLRCGTSIPMEMKDVTEGAYTITLNTRAIGGYQFLLTDHYLGKTVALNGNAYAFVVDGKEGSKDSRRFSVSVADDVLAGIAVTAPAVVNDPTATYTVKITGTVTGASYTLVNTDGTLIAGPVQGNDTGINFPLLADVLDNGKNELTVSALGGCSPVAMTTSFAIEKALTSFGTDAEGVVLVKAYPNPVADRLTLEVADADIQSVQFTTTMGQVVSTVPVVPGQTVYTLDVSTLGSGLYLMVVDKKTVKKSYRLIKK